jgi:hypothetical protein
MDIKDATLMMMAESAGRPGGRPAAREHLAAALAALARHPAPVAVSFKTGVRRRW